MHGPGTNLLFQTIFAVAHPLPTTRATDLCPGMSRKLFRRALRSSDTGFGDVFPLSGIPCVAGGPSRQSSRLQIQSSVFSYTGYFRMNQSRNSSHETLEKIQSSRGRPFSKAEYLTVGLLHGRCCSGDALLCLYAWVGYFLEVGKLSKLSC